MLFIILLSCLRSDIVILETLIVFTYLITYLVFLGLSILDLGPMYATDVRQTSDSIIA